MHVKDAAGGLAAAAARAAAAVAAVGTGAAAGGGDAAPKPAGTAGGGSGAGLLGGDAEAPNAEEVLRRAQAIQSYLCGYEAQVRRCGRHADTWCSKYRMLRNALGEGLSRTIPAL